MHKLIEYVCEELETLEKKAGKGTMSGAEIEYADKLANLKKNLLKGEELYAEQEMEYSGAMGGNMAAGGGSYAGGSYAGGSYARGGRGGGRSNRGGSYARGGSYEGRSYEGRSYEGSYARGDGRGRGSRAQRDSMGRYSSERGYSRDAEEMAEQLRDLMEDAPDENIRREIERLVQKVEQM